MWPFTSIFSSPPCNVPKAFWDRLNTKLDTIQMTLTEAFTSLAASDAELKKDLTEVRGNTDALLAKIAELQNTTLTDEQVAIVNSIAGSAKGIDDIVPDAPTA